MSWNVVGSLKGADGAGAEDLATINVDLARVQSRQIDVRDYGATGDGVTNDTAAIAAAVAAMNAGDTLLVPHGDYRATAWPTMPDRTHIIGNGPGSTRIYRTGWADASYIGWAGSLPGTTVATLTANAGVGANVLTVASTASLTVGSYYRLGGTSSFSTTDPLMYRGEVVCIKSIDSATQVTIYGITRDLYSTAAGSVLLGITFKSDVGMRDLSIIDTEPGVHKKGLVQFYACRNVNVHNVTLDGGDLHGLQLNSVYGAAVSGVHVENGKDDTVNGWYGYGIIATRGCENITITNCQFTRVRHGFTSDSADNTAGVPRNIVVDGCVATETTSVAFDTHATGAAITFTGCSAMRCQTGFQIRSKDTRILGCSVSYCSADGVLFSGDCDGSTLKGSVVRNLKSSSAGRAVRIDGSPDRIVIADNTFENLQGYAIVVNTNARRLKILNNLFAHIGGDGTRKTAIWFSSSITDGIGHIIMGNIFVGNESATSGEASISTQQMDYAVDFGTGTMTGCYVLNNRAMGLALGLVNNAGTNTVINDDSLDEILLTGTLAGDFTYQAKVTGDAHNRLQVWADGSIQWGSGAATPDVLLYRPSADVLRTNDYFYAPRYRVQGTGSAGFIEFEAEQTSDPSVGGVARLFVRDNGSGKTQLCARFATGAVQVISTEP